MPHFALFALLQPCLCMSCSWPRPPAKEGGRGTSVMLPCCYHATATSHSPDRWRVGHIGGAPCFWRQNNFKSVSVCIRSVGAPFLDIWVWRKRERVVFSDTWWVPWHTGDTYSCIKDVQKCILHDRSPLNCTVTFIHVFFLLVFILLSLHFNDCF